MSTSVFCDNAEVVSAVPTILLNPGERTKWESGSQLQASSCNRLIVRPEDFIWLELSIVAEVERVFVERRGNAFQVMTIVNDRSPELRKRIFAREKAIIDEWSQYEFDFDILTRMNYDLKDLVTTYDKPSYAR